MNSKKLTSYCFAGVLVLGSLLSCVKDGMEPVIGETTPQEKGEMVLFSVGNTNVETMTKAATYYMPDQYRFVCRMYYKAASGSELFDVEGGSDITTWLKVDGPIGNALYWRGNYPTLDPANSSLFDSSGNDYDATCFYWQNRKEHAFLAWTDLNRAKEITYSPIRGSQSLKFNPYDVDYQKHTGEEKELWVESGYQVYGAPNDFSTWSDLRKYLETGSNYDANIKNKIPEGVALTDFNNAQYYYAYGWSCKFSNAIAERTQIDDMHATYGWVQYNMYYDKLPYEGGVTGLDTFRDSKGVPTYLYDHTSREYKAEIAVKYFKTDSEGNKIMPEQGFTPSEKTFVERTNAFADPATDHDGDKFVESELICGVDQSTDPVFYYEINPDGSPKLDDEGQRIAFEYEPLTSDTVVEVTVESGAFKCISRNKYVGVIEFVYYKTDSYGNTLFDETNPRYTFYYKQLLNLKKQEVIMTLPANEFDLTRGDKTSISEQPDICQALTIQAPLAATQSSNPANRYFKHQCSQIQVNL
ncbi:MAG: hypothetical protein MJZ16_13950, partial [Bacteroidales bacterium]|nr:hypothetical protein [Bacteroidales bacterium]